MERIKPTIDIHPGKFISVISSPIEMPTQAENIKLYESKGHTTGP